MQINDGGLLKSQHVQPIVPIFQLAASCIYFRTFIRSIQIGEPNKTVKSYEILRTASTCLSETPAEPQLVEQLIANQTRGSYLVLKLRSFKADDTDDIHLSLLIIRMHAISFPEKQVLEVESFEH